jgi:hypothetical protein
MVTPTTLKNVFQVSFILHPSNQQEKMEVVCYVTPTKTGRMRIYYNCHVWHQPPVPGGQWTERSRARLELTESLKAQIASSVAYELCQYGGMDVAVLPYPYHTVREGMESEAHLQGLVQ